MTELRKEINYAVACVNEFADRYNMTPQEAFRFLNKYKAIAFLKENYEIEHTLSFDDVNHNQKSRHQNRKKIIWMNRKWQEA